MRYHVGGNGPPGLASFQHAGQPGRRGPRRHEGRSARRPLQCQGRGGDASSVRKTQGPPRMVETCPGIASILRPCRAPIPCGAAIFEWPWACSSSPPSSPSSHLTCGWAAGSPRPPSARAASSGVIRASTISFPAAPWSKRWPEASVGPRGRFGPIREAACWSRTSRRTPFSSGGTARACASSCSPAATPAQAAGGEPGSNGLARRGGRLVLCEHGDRRVARLEKDGKTTLADRYKGKRLNSPNDLVFRANGDLYFTDPPYGLQGLGRPGKGAGLLRRLPPQEGRHGSTLLTKELTGPTASRFRPRRRRSTSQLRPQPASGWPTPRRPTARSATGRVFFDATPWTRRRRALPDGMKVDARETSSRPGRAASTCSRRTARISASSSPACRPPTGLRRRRLDAVHHREHRGLPDRSHHPRPRVAERREPATRRARRPTRFYGETGYSRGRLVAHSDLEVELLCPGDGDEREQTAAAIELRPGPAQALADARGVRLVARHAPVCRGGEIGRGRGPARLRRRSSSPLAPWRIRERLPVGEKISTSHVGSFLGARRPTEPMDERTTK